MSNALQEALRSGTMTMEDIQLKLNIKCTRSKVYENLVLFKYDMIDTPMADPISQCCRGTILDTDNNWNIVSRPFDKFFNSEEALAVSVDWKTARVQEKLDGSLMNLYYYGGKWNVSSSGNPDAAGNVNGAGFTFADLFWKTWNDLGYVLPDITQKNLTFMFELMTPYNRVVVPHTSNKLVLIGVRDNLTGQEHKVEQYNQYQTVKNFKIKNMADLTESFGSFEGINQEGYVVVDDCFNRVKVKHPQYVMLHHMRGNTGPTLKNTLEIIASGEQMEILSYFPEWQPIYDEVKSRFDKAIKSIEDSYNEAVAKTVGGNQKDFASIATKAPCPDALFKLRSGKHKTVTEYLKSLALDRLMDVVGIGKNESFDLGIKNVL
jgi:T4 RnlA family RNA ligase